MVWVQAEEHSCPVSGLLNNFFFDSAILSYMGMWTRVVHLHASAARGETS